VYLWLERYVLPICATIVFGVVILNPFKLDWTQRLSLLIAISAFAYFVAHTAHKPKTSNVVGGPDQRISFLERQIVDIQAEQKQLASQRADDAKEKERRQNVRGQLAVFLKEGKDIQHGIQYNNPDSIRQKDAWEHHVADYLTKNLDESYAIRFRSPSHQVTFYPSGMDMKMLDSWGNIGEEMAMLNDFMSELRD
jgi:hypothetical protein